MDPRVTVSLIAFVVSLVVGVSGRRLKITGHDVGAAVVVFIVLMILVWVPQPYRDGAVALVVGGGMWAIAGSSVWMVGTGILVLLGHLYVPGGGSAVVVGLLGVLLAWTGVGGAVSHLLRLRRIRQLVVGEPSDFDVEATGTIGSETVRQLELGEGHAAGAVVSDVCAFWVVGAEDDKVSSEDMIRITTADGTALIDPNLVKPDLTSHTVSGSEAVAIAAMVGCTPKNALAVPSEGGSTNVPSIELEWICVGTEACVHGVPRWVKDTAITQQRSYRGGGQLPVFGEGATLLDRSERQVRRDAAFAVFEWTLWVGTMAAVVFVQVWY